MSGFQCKRCVRHLSSFFFLGDLKKLGFELFAFEAEVLFIQVALEKAFEGVRVDKAVDLLLGELDRGVFVGEVGRFNELVVGVRREVDQERRRVHNVRGH